MVPQAEKSDLTSAAVNRRVLRDHIKEYLIEAILRGDYKAGERIVELRIAQQLGVSQTPVREAIRDLVSMGFLESRPFRGTFVRAFSIDELREVYPVRAVLEGLAARLAVHRLREDDFAQLERLLTEMIEAAEAGDIHATTEHNVAFHLIVLRAAGNKTLLRIWEQMQFATFTFLTTNLSDRDLVELATRHREVLEALRSGDPDQAERVMRQHIEELGATL